MKNILFILFTLLCLNSFAENHSAYKLDDTAVEQMFANSSEVNLTVADLSSMMNSSIAAGSKNKIAAGLLGIFCGAFGIHRFYLGHSTAGLIYLGWTLCGGGIIFVISVVTLGFGAILYPFVYLSGVLGFVDGIIYLVTDDKDFDSKFVQNAKLVQWL